MHRIILTLLLAASLLACPLRCGSHAAPSDSASVASACGDDCCQPTPDPSPSQSPGDDCNCVNCICHGAVSGDDSVADAMSQHGVANLWVPVNFRLALPAQVDDLSADCSRHGSGPSLRIAHQSLLI